MTSSASTLELSLAYDPKNSTLVVSVVAIHQFRALVGCADGGSGSVVSPYVRLQLLLPDGRRLKAKTRVVRTVAGEEPAQFGETFAFRELSAGLFGSRLHAAVLGFDRFSRTVAGTWRHNRQPSPSVPGCNSTGTLFHRKKVWISHRYQA